MDGNGTWGRRVMQRADALAAFSSEAGALTRFFLTPEHKAAAQTVVAWMTEAGIPASIDAIGNAVGRVPPARPGARTLMLGSHIDTIRNAGRFDGNLGVLVAIEAMAALTRAGERLPFAVEIVAFGDEEGVRFPQTLSGSRAVAGTFDPAALDGVDQAGITMGAALRAFGGDPGRIAALGRRPGDLLGYLEVHIEQGPVLDHESLPVGVVTAIAGASRLQVDVGGTAGHAGTVPMALRRDALAAAAEMVGVVESLAHDDQAIVATVGRLEPKPGAVNVIPGHVRFTVDLRSPSDAARHAAVARLRGKLEAVATRRGVDLAMAPFYEIAAAPCGADLQATLARAIAQRNLRVLHLASGAGHDGLAMAQLCPIGMLFVRCAGGISHNPAESITETDADVAVEVLIAALRDLGATTTA